MTLPLIYYGNSILRKKSLPVTEITEEVRKLIAQMIATMDAHNGVGLAAVQVGSLVQIIVIRPETVGPDGEFALGPAEIFINPLLTLPSKETEVMNEGCLSIPGVRGEVERPSSIQLEALNLEGKKVVLTLTGLKARQLMHENDHLNGTLFIDRLSSEKKKDIDYKLRELKKRFGDC